MVPAVIINVMRGGPGLGTIQPSQADYFQTTKGGGHGDYRLITLAPATVQEMADFVALGFDLAFKYRTPAIILADGIVGQMMEKVVLPPQRPRRTPEEIAAQCPWAITGKPASRQRNIMTTLELMPQAMEEINIRLQQKYRMIEENEVRFATYGIDDCDLLEIRRERAIELLLEGRRYDDLMRWHLGEKLNKQWYGIYVPALDTPYDLNGDGTNDVCFTKGEAGNEPGVSYIQVGGSSLYSLENDTSGRLLYSVGRNFEEKRYLRPVPQTALNINPDLGQNHYWK